MKRLPIVLTSLILILSYLTLHSQVVKLSVGFDKDSLMIGEQTRFTIRVVKEKSVRVFLPILTDTIARDVEILHSTEIDTLVNGDEITLTQSYLVTAFDTGYMRIPPIPVSFQFGDVQDTIFSRPLSLYITKPEVDINSDFRDIKAPVNTPLSFREILPYAGVSIFGLVVLVALVLLFRRIFRKKKLVEKEKPTLPPYLIALQELQKMLIEKSWEKETIKEYYTRLSGIVRTYLEDQFGFPAMESTTSEIISAFEKVYGKNADMKSKLEELLQLSDLVKFAKGSPLPDENKLNIDKAIFFVEMTKHDETSGEEGKQELIPNN
jgi:hypothetical protein